MGIDNHGIISKGKPYVPLIKAVARRWRLPEVLISHQMHAESNFEPNEVSTAGAVGIMQVLPSTAAVVAARNNIPAGPLENAEINANLGAAYMRENLNTAFKYTNNPETAYKAALVGYLAGPARISKVINNPAEIRNAEQNYIDKVIWDFEKTESWNQVYKWSPGTAEPRRGGRLWLWLILPVAAILWWRNRR